MMKLDRADGPGRWIGLVDRAGGSGLTILQLTEWWVQVYGLDTL